jgi:NAD(P)H dehydrogenase (quinone)
MFMITDIATNKGETKIKTETNMPTVLVIGATGRVGSLVVKELDKESEGIKVCLSSSNPETVRRWQDEGRNARLLDLNQADSFAQALLGIDRIFLLTGYTSEMLYQSKKLIDTAMDAGVKHIVHLGVFTSGCDQIPHFTWHDLVETYIEASGIAWTHLHPNVIADSILVIDPPINEAGSFTVYWNNAPQGWVFAADIAAVAARVLRDGPDKHHGANYWLSTEVLTGPEIAKILTRVLGQEIRCNTLNPIDLKPFIDQIPETFVKAYMESAYITMELAASGNMQLQTIVRDDVQTVLGRPGTTVERWANQYFIKD